MAVSITQLVATSYQGHYLHGLDRSSNHTFLISLYLKRVNLAVRLLIIKTNAGFKVNTKLMHAVCKKQA